MSRKLLSADIDYSILHQFAFDSQGFLTYTCDTANRVSQAVDSITGTITYGYENLARPTSETTGQGRAWSATLMTTRIGWRRLL